jgi:hypothetical protein
MERAASSFYFSNNTILFGRCHCVVIDDIALLLACVGWIFP